MIPTDIIEPVRDWHHRLGLPEVVITDVTADKSKTDRNIVIGKYAPRPCTLGDGVVEKFYTYRNGLLDILEEHSQSGDLDGNYARLPEKALRVAMLLASLENQGGIELRHWARAQNIAERWRFSLHTLFAQVNGDDERDERLQVERALKVVARLGTPTAREVGQLLHIKTQDAERLLETMVRSDELKAVAPRPPHRAVRYALPAVAIVAA